MRAFYLSLFILLGVSCTSADPAADQVADQTAERAEDQGGSDTPETSGAPETSGNPASAAGTSTPPVPRAGDPRRNADGSSGEFTEGMQVMIDDVVYVVQAADYDGPPVIADSSPSVVSPPTPPIPDLPEAPARLEADLSATQHLALIADMHGPTDSVVRELNRLAPFPSVLDNATEVVLVSYQIKTTTGDDGDLFVTVSSIYETLASMEESIAHHHEQLVVAGNEPSQIEIETENGVETARRFDSRIDVDELGSVRVSASARPSDFDPGLTRVALNLRYEVSEDWPTYARLLGWSGIDPLAETPVTGLNYGSTIGGDGVLYGSTTTNWVVPESVDEVVAILGSRAERFEPSEFDSPEYRELVGRANPDLRAVVREYWEGGTEISLLQYWPLLVLDERQSAGPPSSPSQDEDETADVVGDLVALRQIQPDYEAELVEASRNGELLLALIYGVSDDPGALSAIARLNRLAPFPSTIEFPIDSDIWAVALEASYVGGNTNVQQLRYSAIVSTGDEDEQQLYDHFVEQIETAGAVLIDENVTRTSDGVVDDAELGFIVEDRGIVTRYDLDLGRGRFDVEVTYQALTEPDYVELLAGNITADLPFEGPLVAASLATDSGPLSFGIVFDYRESGTDGSTVLAELVPIIEQIGTLESESSTTLRYSQPGVDMRVERDDWGFGPGTIMFISRPPSG